MLPAFSCQKAYFDGIILSFIGMTMEDIIGKKFNKWEVLSYSGKLNSSRQKLFLCRCECGSIVERTGNALRHNKSKSCQQCCVSKKTIIIGQKIGKLIVLDKSEKKSKFSHLYYKCQCDCGEIVNVRADALRNIKSSKCKSCSSIENNKNRLCLQCKCKNHEEIDLETSECDLVGFCKRCDKFDKKYYFEGSKILDQIGLFKNNFLKRSY